MPPTAPAIPTAPSAPAEIEARVPALLGRLAERFDPELIVIACNTASTIALDAVRAALDLPIVGTVPAIKPAAALSKTRTIGVLGTEATVRQPYVDRLAGRVRRRLHRHPPRLGRAGRPRRGQAARRAGRAGRLSRAALDGLFAQPGGERIDTIVLACTHFPLVEEELAAAAPRPVRFVDGKEGIARRTAWLTRDLAWPDEPPRASPCSPAADTDVEAYRAGHWLRYGLTRLERL